MARALGQAGACIILNGRETERLEAARAELAGEGLDVAAAAFDVTEPDAARAALEAVSGEAGAVDILVNNAGVNLREPLEELDPELWERTLATNLTGLFRLTQHVVRGMIGRGRGRIINIASLQSFVTRRTLGAYTASKGGVAMLTKSMAVEWGGMGIRANAIAPGYFRTDMSAKAWNDPDVRRRVNDRIPVGRWGEPEDLAGAVIFLASDAAEYVNGQVLAVDGGLLASL
jgi:gluconate 5-dehydrogenase